MLLCLLRVSVLRDAHPKALKSKTGDLLGLSISRFQILCVVNHRLQKVIWGVIDD